MKWFFLLLLLFLLGLGWWVRQPAPDWMPTADTDAPVINDNQSGALSPQEALSPAEIPAAEFPADEFPAAVSDDVPSPEQSIPTEKNTRATEDCLTLAELENHPGTALAREWLRDALLFYNWGEEHFLLQDEAAILIEAQAGNALAMRALAIYYAAPMLRPEFQQQAPAELPEPSFHQARYWLYQAALHNVPMMFAFQAFTHLDELTALEQNKTADGELPEPYFSQQRQLLVRINALLEFDLWVSPVLEQVRTEPFMFGIADTEFSREEQQLLAAQLDELKSEWRFHRSQLGQPERIEIELPAEVAAAFELFKAAERCQQTEEH